MSNDRTTEIINYLSAMSRDIGEFRSEIAKQFAELRGRVSIVEHSLLQLQIDVTREFVEMRSEIAKLQSDVAELQRDVAELRREFAKMRSEVGEIKYEMRIFSDEKQRMNVRHLELSDRVSLLEGRKVRVETKAPPDSPGA